MEGSGPLLIIPEIGIFASGNQVSEFLLPFNHLYQARSGPGLREVPVDTFQDMHIFREPAR